MNDGNKDVPSENKDLDNVLARQREAVMLAVRKHQFRHKWFSRTLSTLFWSLAAGGFLLAVITQNDSLMVSVIFWLVLGAIVLIGSRLKLIELKIDEILALPDNSGSDDGAQQNDDS